MVASQIQLNSTEAEYWRCPVCLSGYISSETEDRAHHAAHCCLWKFIGHYERVRIAELVERGAKWKQAIEEVVHAHCA